MKTCAIMISPDCKVGITKGGICCNCWKYLIQEGLIQKGDKFENYPTWLQEMVRIQDTFDSYHEGEDSLEGDLEQEIA